MRSVKCTQNMPYGSTMDQDSAFPSCIVKSLSSLFPERFKSVTNILIGQLIATHPQKTTCLFIYSGIGVLYSKTMTIDDHSILESMFQTNCLRFASKTDIL
jgi:hypothetical protein